MNLKYIKENSALSSEDLHSSYLFYTMALDYCVKKLDKIEEFVENLRSPHCKNCSQLLNGKGKCTGDCMADYKKEFQKILEE